MTAALAQFGGFVLLGGRNLIVSARTIRHAFELQSHVKALIYSPMDELRVLLVKNKHLRKKSFVADWIKQCRLLWLGKFDEMVSQFVASPEGRVFLLWQSVRGNGVDYDWVCSAVDREIEKRGVSSGFWGEVNRRVAIGGGVDEISALSQLRKKRPSEGEKTTLDGAISWLISERGWSKEAILDMTIESLRQVREKGPELEDLVKEESVAETEPGLAMLKESQRRIYRLAAKSIIEGGRVDGYDEKEERSGWPMYETTVDGQKVQILECAKCRAAGKEGRKVMLKKEQMTQVGVGLKTRIRFLCQICGHTGRKGIGSLKDAVTIWNVANKPPEKDDD